MLYLNKQGDSIIILTLREKCKLDESYYTFHLENKDSKEDFIFSAPDISPYPEVYNKFVITIDYDNPRPDLGKLYLPEGQYNYFTYESETPKELDIDNCGTILEYGILNVGNPVNTQKVREIPENNIKVRKI